MGKRISIEVINEFLNHTEYTLIKETTKKGFKHLLVLIDKEGFYYSTLFDNLKRGCIPSKFNTSNPYTIFNIKLFCEINQKPFKLVSDVYKGKDKKLQWKCLKEECGEIFPSRFDDIFHGHGCGFCTGMQVGLSNCLATKSPELAKEFHPTKNGNLNIFNIACNSSKKVWWQCLKNPKHEWYVSVDSRNNTKISGCPYCSSNPKPSEDYNLLVINPTLCKEWNYEKNKKSPEEYCPNANKKVWWICNQCNHEWNALISSRNDFCKTGCPECAKDNKGETKIQEILNKNNIYNTHQFTIKDCRDKRLLPFDHAIFKDKEKTNLLFLVEYDGLQHFEPRNFGGISDERALENFKITQIHDKIKNNFCIIHNIPLLRIPYWDFDNIETILTKYLQELELSKNKDSSIVC